MHGFSASRCGFTIITLFGRGRTKSSLSSNRFSFLNFHDFLYNTVFHKIVDLRSIDCLPISDPLFECPLELNLHIIDVGYLIIVVHP